MFDIIMGLLSLLIILVLILVPRKETDQDKAIRNSQEVNDWGL